MKTSLIGIALLILLSGCAATPSASPQGPATGPATTHPANPFPLIRSEITPLPHDWQARNATWQTNFHLNEDLTYTLTVKNITPKIREVWDDFSDTSASEKWGSPFRYRLITAKGTCLTEDTKTGEQWSLQFPDMGCSSGMDLEDNIKSVLPDGVLTKTGSLWDAMPLPIASGGEWEHLAGSRLNIRIIGLLEDSDDEEAADVNLESISIETGDILISPAAEKCLAELNQKTEEHIHGTTQPAGNVPKP